MLRILLVDDHPIVLEALAVQLGRAFPDSEITPAPDLKRAVDLIESGHNFDFALIDFGLPGVRGAEGIVLMKQHLPSIPLVVMSGTAHSADVEDCIRAGASGFLPKTLPAAVFISALNVVMAGGTYLPTEMMVGGYGMRREPVKAVAEDADGAALDIPSLTPREIEVLTDLVTGLSNKEIARRLVVEEVTVKLHIRHIFQKLGVRNRAEAAAMAVRRNLTNQHVLHD